MKPITLLLIFVVFIGCKNSNRPLTALEKSISETKNHQQKHPGKKLMETSCYSCHSLTAPENSRIAPPMIAIKNRYITKNTTKEEFVNDMQNWMKNPTNEKAKMHGAVKRFGLMPKLGYPEETIQKISEYMYDYDIEKPEWFDEHHKNQHPKRKKISLTYKERGLEYALSTKAVLGKNLMSKIQKNGTLAALEFCNIKAYPLTDSMSVVNKATIKRVSDKPRDQKNIASNIENGYINIFKENVKTNTKSDPILVISEKKVKFYYPIITNRMCLQCHGNTNSDIEFSTLDKIKNLYPEDLATGYQENQVRGIWSITFDK
ncbi:DUF3365 domain-containing protein [Polaribacter sp. Asnod6-C07]|uniref:c-type heme family protein n=1 Tax=Polaribacter sp. Asnod6-C07 TaxID=3160582 RepID=UPI0038666342